MFKKGDIVKHVLDGRKMIVIDIRTERKEEDWEWKGGDRKIREVKIIKGLEYECRHVHGEKLGYYEVEWFYPEELEPSK